MTIITFRSLYCIFALKFYTCGIPGHKFLALLCWRWSGSKWGEGRLCRLAPSSPVVTFPVAMGIYAGWDRIRADVQREGVGISGRRRMGWGGVLGLSREEPRRMEGQRWSHHLSAAIKKYQAGVRS
jgi:hypothetical protein